MIRSTNIQREIAKKMMLKTGEFVSVKHFSGSPTWGGDYDQTPSYTSSTATVICRPAPIREEIKFGDQVFGAEDIRGWFPYDTTIDIQDLVTFSGTSLFSGTWIVGGIEKTETSYGTFLRFQRAT